MGWRGLRQVHGRNRPSPQTTSGVRPGLMHLLARHRMALARQDTGAVRRPGAAARLSALLCRASGSSTCSGSSRPGKAQGRSWQSRSHNQRRVLPGSHQGEGSVRPAGSGGVVAGGCSHYSVNHSPSPALGRRQTGRWAGRWHGCHHSRGSSCSGGDEEPALLPPPRRNLLDVLTHSSKCSLGATSRSGSAALGDSPGKVPALPGGGRSGRQGCGKPRLAEVT